MPINSQSSLMMLLSKLAPQSIRSLSGASEDWDVSLPQRLGDRFCSLIGGHVHHNVLHKVVTKDQKAPHVWVLVQLHIIVSMLVKSTCSNSKGAVTMMGCTFGALAWLPSCWVHHLHLADGLLHLCEPFLAKRTGHVASTACLLLILVSSISVASIHGSYSGRAMGNTWIAQLLPTHPVRCMVMAEWILDRVLASSTPHRIVFPSSVFVHHLPAGVLDPVLSG